MDLTRHSTCPHCGGTNDLSPMAILVHCSYCESAYTFKDNRAEYLGTVALPAKTASPFQLYQVGQYKDESFEIRGHLRYRYSGGYWDEWFGITARGTQIWIAEDEKEYSIFIREELEDQLDYDDLRPGQIINVSGIPFMIEERDQASLAGFEGEIPFELSLDKTFPYVAGVSNEERITLEFGEKGIERYRGKTVTLADIGITPVQQFPGQADQKDRLNHSEDVAMEEGEVLPGADAGKEAKLSCQCCGSPLKLSGDPQQTTTVICSYCGSTLDIKTATIVKKLTSYNPPYFVMDLGTKGTLNGKQVTVVGRIRMVEQDWYWDEFLLYNEDEGYSWLIDDEGNWSTNRRIRAVPAELPQSISKGEIINYQNLQFKVKEHSHGSISFIDGEFPYFTETGTVSHGFDAVCQNHVLSCQWNENEVEWYAGSVLTPQEVAEAFNLETAPINEETEALKRSAAWRNHAIVFIAIAIVLLITFSATKRQVHSISIDHQNYNENVSKEGYAEAEIKIPRKGNYLFKYHSSLSNNWVYLITEVQDSAQTPIYQYSTEISYYSGYEGGESWSEGSRTKSQVLKFKEPGTYHLLFSGENGSSAPSVSLKIYKGAFIKRYLIIFIVICILIILRDLTKRGVIEFDD